MGVDRVKGVARTAESQSVQPVRRGITLHAGLASPPVDLFRVIPILVVSSSLR